jgi:hypothetical protein
MEGVRVAEMEEFPRTPPARHRRISAIRAGDRRVRVVGVVVDRKDSEFTIDDRSGRITVIFDDPSVASGIGIESKVKVIGVPLTVSGRTELRAEIIRKVDGLDLELYDEFMSLLENMERGEVD